MLILRRLLPKSLLWRSVLIVVTPMVALIVIVASLIVQRHFDGVTRQMTASVAGELRLVLETVNRSATGSEARSEVARASRLLGYPIVLDSGGEIPTDADPAFYDVIGIAVAETLRAQLPGEMFAALDREAKILDVRIPTQWGVLRASPARGRVIATNPHLLLTWMAVAAAGLITVALLYLRNQIRPVEKLAEAADAFGKGRSVPIKIAGAAEVRLASAAFLDARSRIERHIEQRTRMLSGVSHDLRTPLTRMRLALEMMEQDGPEIADLRADVGEMERILKEFLDYARGDQGEEVVDTDVAALAREVVREARRKGASISLYEQVETPGETRLAVRPLAIKRTLHNLLENALSYGRRVGLSVTIARGFVEFAVEDDGPGIPENQREDALRAFSRLDESRNRNKRDGVGLGLALALDAMRGHGGDLLLDDSPSLGGLRARARLPR